MSLHFVGTFRDPRSLFDLPAYLSVRPASQEDPASTSDPQSDHFPPPPPESARDGGGGAFYPDDGDDGILLGADAGADDDLEVEAVEGYEAPPEPGPDMDVWGAKGVVEAEEAKLAGQARA